MALYPLVCRLRILVTLGIPLLCLLPLKRLKQLTIASFDRILKISRTRRLDWPRVWARLSSAGA
eukprot:1159192-Pelagomonas_calceolata.AAC.5